MKKQGIALFLVLVMCLGLLPLAALGAEAPKLPMPQGLTWGAYYEETVPGCASAWAVSHMGEADMFYYSAANEKKPVAETHWVELAEPEWSDSSFVEVSAELPSGDYYFTVQLKGDGESYEDSEIARSPVWTYTKPSAKLPAPSAPVISAQGTIPEGWEYTEEEVAAYVRWDKPVQTADSGYVCQFFFSATNGNAKDVGSLEMVGSGSSLFDDAMMDLLTVDQTQDQSSGYYYARVRSLSRDITQCQNSAWSPLSKAFYYGNGTGEPPVEPEKPGPIFDRLTLNRSGVNLQVGQSADVTATVRGYEGKSVYAMSADTDVATVEIENNTVTVTGQTLGRTSVYVFMWDGQEVTLEEVRKDLNAQEVAVIVANQSTGGGGSSIIGGGGGGGKPAVGGKPAAGGTPVNGGTATTGTPAIKPASEKFRDVVKDSWYEDGVTFVTEKGLFNGVSEGVFAPQTNMTRAMLMTVLARLDGQDTTGGSTWYSKAMEWAKAQGISDGTMAEGNVTREQMVTMLYRYVKAQKADGDLGKFADGGKVSDWAKEAMSWAVANGILTGKDGSRLDPQGTATRAEVATILQRFVEKTGK